MTPEFTAMLLGLTLYTASFNAEIIRAGILAVSRGQSEAGLALGLSRGQVMRKIVLPQALRIIIPPMTNSYLNLTKESSLAVAIGYPEIVRVANITLAETSQAVECISIIMVIYLTLSLITAVILNWANARARLVER
jgi:general L-amino acid transport system permease protein